MKAAVFTIKRPLWGVFNAIVLDLHKRPEPFDFGPAGRSLS